VPKVCLHVSVVHVPANSHEQCTPSSTGRCQVSRVAHRQETYLAQTHTRETEATGNDAHQNALATWPEVKTLHKQQKFSYTKQYSNNAEPMEYKCGLGLPIPT
jgi:hypothetical protein